MAINGRVSSICGLHSQVASNEPLSLSHLALDLGRLVSEGNKLDAIQGHRQTH